ncbi:MAG: type II toxin-antitoxin system HicB family antitoxin [Nitrospinae bacterium]|nr:type II toxin-antitoxin system HicB family antitoxin [Nitrospinota bacterium]
MNKYLIFIEKYGDSFSAFAPDLPGCVAVGETIEETEELMRQAIHMHLEDMKQTGESIPSPSAVFRYVEV